MQQQELDALFDRQAAGYDTTAPGYPEMLRLWMRTMADAGFDGRR